VAAACGGFVFSMVGGTQSAMMFVAATSLVIGACCVYLITDKK